MTRQDNSGDGANEGADGSTHKNVGSSSSFGTTEYQHNNSANSRESQKLSYAEKQNNGATRGRKLVNKKRKRIGMRRECEAQLQLESSESCEVVENQFFKPGRPVTLDQVLVFSTIPR
jgi:hypothetical protein